MNNIKIGDTILISSHLEKRLIELGFDRDESANIHAMWAGNVAKAYAIWEDEGVKYVTIDLCVEIPLDCCVPWEAAQEPLFVV